MSNQWISVKDRLPTSVVNKVLVCCKNGYVGFGHYEDYKNTKTWFNLESGKAFTDWNLGDDEAGYTVTHWMPLPEPPNERTN